MEPTTSSSANPPYRHRDGDGGNCPADTRHEPRLAHRRHGDVSGSTQCGRILTVGRRGFVNPGGNAVVCEGGHTAAAGARALCVPAGHAVRVARRAAASEAPTACSSLSSGSRSGAAAPVGNRARAGAAADRGPAYRMGPVLADRPVPAAAAPRRNACTSPRTGGEILVANLTRPGRRPHAFPAFPARCYLAVPRRAVRRPAARSVARSS
jgi:hypothetical protein